MSPPRTARNARGEYLFSGFQGKTQPFVREADVKGTALALTPQDYEAVLRSPSFDLYREFWGEAER